MFVIIKTSSLDFGKQETIYSAATEAQAEQIAMELAARDGATYTILEPIKNCVFRAVTEIQTLPTQRGPV